MSADTSVDAVVETKSKVHEYLSTFDNVEIHDDGNCSLRYGSAKVDVWVEIFDEDQAIAKVSATCVTGAAPSPELYRHVATHRTEIGHLRVTDEADGTCTIDFRHGLMGEFLNSGELRMSVVAVAFLADQLDDDLAAKFGGTVYDASANRS